ncbi:hypothetical protein [Streptomyces sp. NPDC052107]|uniref:hypothetical protein n=1 Tax=Streptomyces sp. NPDC052107 TaxID=3155632 RepID=UPI003428C91E
MSADVGGHLPLPVPLPVTAEPAPAATGTLSIPGAVAAPAGYAATSQGALNGVRQAGSALGGVPCSARWARSATGRRDRRAVGGADR